MDWVTVVLFGAGIVCIVAIALWSLWDHQRQLDQHAKDVQAIYDEHLADLRRLH